MNTDAAWYVYIVRCSDDTLYTGATKNLFKRIDKHNAGQGAKYTRARLPVLLFWFQKVSSKSEALKLECAIKKLSRSKKLELGNANDGYA